MEEAKDSAESQPVDTDTTTPSSTTKKKTSELPEELKTVISADLNVVVVKKLPDPKDPAKFEEVATSLHGCQLSQLKVEQICKLCLLLGVPKYKGKGKLAYQLLIVYAKKFQSIPNLIARKTDNNLNTKFWIVNAYFHDDNYHYSFKINDKKTRVELDAGKKSTEFNLYERLASYVNDTDNNDAIGELVPFADSDISGRIDIMKNKGIDPKIFNPVNAAAVKSMFDNIKKSWNKVVRNMKASGTHNSDPWDFCIHQGGDITYYFFLYVDSRGGMKEKLQVDLPKNIFSCSVNNNSVVVLDGDHNDDEQVLNNKTLQRSKRGTNNDKMLAIQRELAEANHKVQREIAEAQSQKDALLTQQMLASQEKRHQELLALQEKHQDAKERNAAIKANKKELNVWVAKKDAAVSELDSATTNFKRAMLVSHIDGCKQRINMYKTWLVENDPYYILTSPLARKKRWNDTLSSDSSDDGSVGFKVQKCL